jgi:PAS domain S-box-containing protein
MDVRKEGYRILIVAPYGSDAESMARILGNNGYETTICFDLAGLAFALGEDIGVVFITQEALRGDVQQLRSALAAQPSWSDIPFIFLTSRRTGLVDAAEAARLRLSEFISNAIVMERPLGLASLLSAVTSAIRARRRQFEMRDRLLELDTARRDLSERETQLRLAVEAAEIGLWDVDPIQDTLYWPPRVKEMFGISPDVPVSMADFYAGLHPEDAEKTAQAYTAATDPQRRAVYDVEYRTIGKEDGAVRWVAAKGRGIFDNDGRCVRVIGTAIDITSRKAVELELVSLNTTLEQRVAERTDRLMQAEAALHQSQKMEAIGQLTGGIAHDFNNMLTGVIGAIDLVKRRLASGRTENLDRYMDTASSSAERAARLTQRLLAFSRRQSLDAKPLDANALIMSLDEFLRRTIPENVSLKIVPASTPLHAVADVNQLENAIINLAINARDAMPDGGLLTLETRLAEVDQRYGEARAIKPGRYALIAVSDTGVGISQEIMDKIFDPFFTTKPVGQGTGLGLSMVYGFVRQSGGQVRVHSKSGEGTTVSLYLPAYEGPLDDNSQERAQAPAEGRGQAVLVVEDDPSVRLLVREVLEELRYKPLEVDNPGAALPILSGADRIDLLISDVGLPGMNGRQLAEIARQRRPELPILFMTGYAENAAIRAGFLGTNMAMIAKPFALDALAQKISEMLNHKQRSQQE